MVVAGRVAMGTTRGRAERARTRHLWAAETSAFSSIGIYTDGRLSTKNLVPVSPLLLRLDAPPFFPRRWARVQGLSVPTLPASPFLSLGRLLTDVVAAHWVKQTLTWGTKEPCLGPRGSLVAF